ncbi:MAG: AAA family ATPase [Bacilli bacterium]|nr:AAA family ATPase [Bacilli bacterium]
MRTLLLLRGAPGCGKSTFIDTNGLRPYAISADEIRLLCQSSQQTANGLEEISQKNDRAVWSMLFKILDIRMSNGEFTVIDATNSKTDEIKRYKEMADQYRYRIYLVDFTDLPIEECKHRNMQRPPLKQVPEEVIDKMYARFQNQNVPSGIKVIKPNELDSIWFKKFDMNKYEKIVHIGDIHGCYTALMEYFKNGLNDNYMYIFLGDLLDRGIENAEVLKFMINICNKPNVLILEGNHEHNLWIYSQGGVSRSKDFEFITRPQLEAARVSYSDIRKLYRRLGQCAYYTFDNKDVFVSHAGIARLIDNMTFMSTSQLIYGVGKYDETDTINATWMNTSNENEYQIYGHRNIKNDSTQAADRIFNLDGNVEYGGHLRIVELSTDGFNVINIKNDVFEEPKIVETSNEVIQSSIADTILDLRRNRYIRESMFGNISSFNFTKEAFYDKVWDAQTMVARGLYINTATMDIVARGFNKFFNVNERPETKLEMLQYTLQFPVTCYIKENGFLGLVSYNHEIDDLFITTKSNPDGDYAKYLKDMIYKKCSAETREKMKNICKDEKITLVFECVDMTNDPHIIEYAEDELILIAAIKNEIKFEQYDYDNLVKLANDLKVKVKIKAFEINSYSEFFDWYNEVTAEGYLYEGKNIEGFVIEDSVGNMTKVKLAYYNFWKFMRAVSQQTLKYGRFSRAGALLTPESNDFYTFCKNIYNSHTPEELAIMPTNIIYLRNEYLKTK